MRGSAQVFNSRSKRPIIPYKPLDSATNLHTLGGGVPISSFSASFSSAASASGVGISLLNDRDYFNRLKLSQPINPSSENFESDQIYVIDDRSRLWLYVGRSVPQEVLEEIFLLPPNTSSNSRYERSERVTLNNKTRLGRRVEDFLAVIANDGSDSPSEMRVIWGDCMNLMPSIHKFTSRLIEDANNWMMSYVDYLCVLHARMTGNMNNTKK